MHVQIALFVKVRRDVEVCGAGAQVRDSGLRGLFHHVAELSGQRNFTLAGRAERLDVERHTTD